MWGLEGRQGESIRLHKRGRLILDIEDFNIRDATLEDVNALEFLVNAAFRGESSKNGWTTEEHLLGGQRTDKETLELMLVTPSNTVLVAEANDRNKERIGKLSACVLLAKKDDVLYLGMLTVAPELQGLGVGKHLLKAAEKFGTQVNCQKIEMTVIAQRIELIDWYKRHGYLQTDEVRPFPYGNLRFGEPKRDDLHFIVLEKTL